MFVKTKKLTVKRAIMLLDVVYFRIVDGDIDQYIFRKDEYLDGGFEPCADNEILEIYEEGNRIAIYC